MNLKSHVLMLLSSCCVSSAPEKVKLVKLVVCSKCIWNCIWWLLFPLGSGEEIQIVTLQVLPPACWRWHIKYWQISGGRSFVFALKVTHRSVTVTALSASMNQCWVCLCFVLLNFNNTLYVLGWYLFVNINKKCTSPVAALLTSKATQHMMALLYN